MKSFITYAKNHGYLAAIVLSIIYILPLLVANFYYIDDVSRSVGGYARWLDNGRPLAEWIILTMGFGGVIDIAPAPLILCAVAMITAGFYLSKKIGVNRKTSAILISLSILCSPFYIQNLSYRYDAFTMGLSVSSAIVAASMLLEDLSKKKIVLSVMLITAMLSLYQASVNAYIGIVCFCSIINLNKSGIKAFISYVAISVAALFLGMILYKFLVAEVFVSGGYSVSHSETVNISTSSLPIIYKNIDTFLNVFRSTFNGWFGTVFLLSFILAAMSATVNSILNAKSKTTVIVNIFFVTCSLATLIFSIIGMMFILSHPVFYPRVFIGFIAVMVFIIYNTSTALNGRLVIIPALVIACSFLQMYSYGNALSAQKQKEDFIFSMMAQDIVKHNGGINKIRFNGTVTMPPTAELIANRFGIMKHIIPTYIRPDWMFGAFYLGRLGVNVIYDSNIDIHKTIIDECKNKVSSNAFYTAMVKDRTMLFDFNKCK
ncbi:glucosyltransferase domain-containing protein [Citrobacter sp. OP27]